MSKPTKITFNREYKTDNGVIFYYTILIDEKEFYFSTNKRDNLKFQEGVEVEYEIVPNKKDKRGLDKIDVKKNDSFKRGTYSIEEQNKSSRTTAFNAQTEYLILFKDTDKTTDLRKKEFLNIFFNWIKSNGDDIKSRINSQGIVNSFVRRINTLPLELIPTDEAAIVSMLDQIYKIINE